MLGISPRTVYRWEKGETRPDPVRVEKLKEVVNLYSRRIPPKKPLFRFIDLFAGIGGLRKAFESVGGRCVFTSEWDSWCRKTYQENFVCDHDVEGDIRDVDLDSVPPYDVLLAGFPCQPFSISGVSKRKSL